MNILSGDSRLCFDENGKIIQKVKLPEGYRILNESTADKIDEILMNVVKNGNGKKAHSDFIINHGKTATAQSGWYENGREIILKKNIY